ncbi:MAG: hypothetical protein GX608_07165, partial [Lentisphaerae bacterium]|nr:hypothetical protein [Lentisphaerota bacterium]
DNWQQKHIDPAKIFPENQDISVTNDFSPAVIELNSAATNVRKALDSIKVFSVALPEDKVRIIDLVKSVRDSAAKYAAVYARARKIADAYPDSPGGRVMREMLVDVGEEKLVMDSGALVSELNRFLLT